MPVFAALVLEDGDVDHLEDGGSLDLGDEDLDEGAGDVVGDEGAPPGHVGRRAGLGVAPGFRQADGGNVRRVVDGSTQGEDSHVISG